jgi:hypothetical protein
VRRLLPGRDGFRPYVRLAAAARVLRFGGDRVGGFAIPVQLAGGVRYRILDDIAVGGEAAIEVGPGWLGHGLGVQLERGFVIGAIAEVALP